MLSANHPGLAGRHHQNLGLTGVGRQISGARMHHRDRGVGGLQHQRHRLSHQDAAANHNGPLPGGINAIATQQRHHTSWRAAARTGLPPQQATQVERVQAIGIFGWIELQQQGPIIQAIGHRQLHEDSINGRVVVQLPQLGLNLSLGGGGSQVGAMAGQTHAGASFFLIGHVHTTGRILANPQHRQTRRPASLLQP